MKRSMLRCLTTLLVVAVLAPCLAGQRSIQFGDALPAVIDPPSDTDDFVFEGAPGERIILQASWTGGFASFQPCVDLRDPNGTLIAQACTANFTNRIDVTLPAAGQYRATVYDFPSTLSIGLYTLALERVFPDPSPKFGALDFVENQIESASLGPRGELDSFCFTARANAPVRLTATVSQGNPSFEPFVELYDPTGALVASAGNGAFSVSIETTLIRAGRYVIVFSDFLPSGLSFPQSGGYTIQLECLSADCRSTASWNELGTGCPSPGGPTPALSSSDMPVAGTLFTVNLANLPAVPSANPFVVLSTRERVPPLDLGTIGMPGCTLYVGDPHVPVMLVNESGQASWSFRIPLAPALIGVELVIQGGVLVPGANAVGIIVSNAGAGTIG